VSQPEILNQAFELGYTYTRSTGPVVGRFLTELKKRNIVGIKASDGRVVVPPMEYDPDTGRDRQFRLGQGAARSASNAGAVCVGDDQTRWRRCADDPLCRGSGGK
jgi:hypothetical protein